ncbi:MAG: hypothetical protein ACLFP4_16830 [Spirochaetales bacterium]
MELEGTAFIVMTGIAAGLFALMHIFIGRLAFIDVLPRSRWLSVAGGIAVAYVFLRILPELSTHQETFANGLGVPAQTAESWVYLVAFAGLAVFYGLERAAKLSRQSGGEELVQSELLWLHLFAFAIYNVVIGYLLLHRDDPGFWSLIIYMVAILLHFMTSDYGLRQDQKGLYDRFGRWIIAAAVIAGWAIGVFASLPQLVVGFLFAFVAGGIMLNVLKEELPEERKSKFWPFAFGGVSYSVLLLLI